MTATYNHLCYSTMTLARPDIDSCRTRPSTMPHTPGTAECSNAHNSASYLSTCKIRCTSVHRPAGPLTRWRDEGDQFYKTRTRGMVGKATCMVELLDETTGGMPYRWLLVTNLCAYEDTQPSVNIMIIECATNSAT